ncbi:MAG: penicillin-binding protein 2 [Holosporaceae bacterium]|jgi:penicillin-binding protein 2|nr:penicillin-binding protein 2 [Holosporaceae bacterium]
MRHSASVKKELHRRTAIVLYLALFLMSLLVGKLYFLQIYCYGKYFSMAEKNRIRLSPLLPKRGRIFTADKKVIAKNKRHHKLTIESCGEKKFSENLELLARCLDMAEEEKKSILEVHRSFPRHAPIVVRDGLSWDEYSKLSLIFHRLTHVSTDSVYVREYPDPLEYCHVVGYVSRSDNGLQILTGKTGLEQSINDELIGEIGAMRTEINAVGRKMRLLDSTDPINGQDVVLTINSEIQKYVFDLLAAEKAGACVVLNIENGDILAMVSVPGFDNNLISSKISREQWTALTNDPLAPLLNRTISCTYPPGSIFKIVVAIAALSEGIISPSYTVHCAGGIKYGDNVFHCWNRGGHGRVNIYDAICMSCDCFFFEISQKLGIDKIVEYAEKFGFGKIAGLGLGNENAGLLPSRKWKLLRYGNSWKPYETLITGIGQGALLTTLMQLTVLFGKLYSNNYDFVPRLLAQRAPDFLSSKNKIDERYAGIVKEALHRVCNCWNGTASGSCKSSYEIAGKTGSSQVRRLKSNEAGLNQANFPWHMRDHAIFVGVAPCKNQTPRYVVAVLLEHGSSGARAAAPIARKIFDKLMAHPDGIAKN